MKKVAIIIPDLYHGGAERAAGVLSIHLSPYYDVYLMLLEVKNIIYEYSGTILDCGLDGVDCYEYYIGCYKNKYNFDCTISFMEPFNFMNIRTRQKGEKIIVSERCVQSVIVPEQVYENYFIKKLYNYADEVVCISYGVANDMAENFQIDTSKLTTIYYFDESENVKEKAFCDLEESNCSEIKKFVSNSKYFVSIGRLEEQKNHRKLIVQFSILIKKYEDIKLLIIGNGSLKDELLSLISSLNMEKNIRIVSRVANPFIYLKNAYALLVASEYEGLGNVMFEAFILGVPVIATDCEAGPRELLSGDRDYKIKRETNEIVERGILVPKVDRDTTGETHYMAEAMEYLLNNENVRDMIVEKELLYMENYDNRTILKQWIEVIERKKPSANKYENAYMNGEKVCIYGAGKIAKMAIRYLKLNNIKIDRIIVTKLNGNVPEIEGIPVVELDAVKNEVNQIDLILGVGGTIRSEVMKKILPMGFKSIEIASVYPEAIF